MAWTVSGGTEMNLWCDSGAGPVPRSQKIILQPNPDSFTCRGHAGRTQIVIQRTQSGCNYCYLTYECEGKVVLRLHRDSSNREALTAGDCNLP